LEAHERELETERRRLQEKDSQIASVQECLQRQLQGSEQESSRSSRSLEELHSELQAKHRHHEEALENQRKRIEEEHKEELHATLKAREQELIRTLGDRAEQAEREAVSRREAEEMAKAEVAAGLNQARAAADVEVRKHRAEVEAARAELRMLRGQIDPLRAEHSEAADKLLSARTSLREEQEERMSGKQVSALQLRLAEAHREHERAEQRHGDVTAHLKAHLRDLNDELQSHTEELKERDAVVLRRDQELAEVNGQLSDLQGLFDEVNGQLQRECGRIERLQGAVTQCARQAKELESLQNMLEESHRMLAQLRETLDKERAERLRVAGLLEHEQQRTQLLLDVLKHFKEKLQGLTPQMLLGRLGVSDPKVLFSSPWLQQQFEETGKVQPAKGPVQSGADLPFALGTSPGLTPPMFSGTEWQTPSPKPCAWPAGFEVPPVPMATPPGAPSASLVCGR